MKIKEYILSIMHIRTLFDFLVSFFVASTAGIAAYFKVIYLDDPNVFQAIAWVVFVDFGVGISLAFKRDNFQTKKALKVVYYLVAYSVLAAMVLKVEDGFPSAFWLSEALIMPILIGQIISTAKNLHLLGIIKNKTLADILTKIDKHKDLDHEGN